MCLGQASMLTMRHEAALSGSVTCHCRSCVLLWERMGPSNSAAKMEPPPGIFARRESEQLQHLLDDAIGGSPVHELERSVKALQVEIRSLKADMDILKANNVEIRTLKADMEILKENNERLLNVTSALVGGAVTNYIEVMRNPDSGSLLRRNAFPPVLEGKGTQSGRASRARQQQHDGHVQSEVIKFDP